MDSPVLALSQMLLRARCRLVGDGVWVAGARLATAASAFAAQLLLARLLTSSDLGAYFVALSLTVPLAAIGQLGLGPIALREVALAVAYQAPARARWVILRAAQAGLIGAGAVLLATSLLGPLIAIPLALSALCGLWSAFLIGQGLLAELLRGLGQARLAALLNGAISNVTTLLPFLAIWRAGAPLELSVALMIILAGAALSVLVGIVGLWRQLAQPLPSGRHPLVRNDPGSSTGAPPASVVPESAASGVDPGAVPPSEPSLWMMVRQARPLLLNQFFLLVMSRADLWIVGLMGAPALVAGYAIAGRLALFVAMPLEIGRATLAGRIATLCVRHEPGRLERLLRGSATMMLLAALAIALVWTGFGGSLIGLIYGAPYASAAPLLVILSLGQLANVATGLCAQTLILAGHGKLVLRVNVVAGLGTLGLMVGVAIYAGLLAVAVVAAAGVTLRTSLMLVGLRRRVGVWSHAGLFSLK